MTRETKLGLLLGTAIILLIGIIVSDQLSVARKQPPPPPQTFGLDETPLPSHDLSTSPSLAQPPTLTPPSSSPSPTSVEQPLPSAALRSGLSEPVPALNISEKALDNAKASPSTAQAPTLQAQPIGLFDPPPATPSGAPAPAADLNSSTSAAQSSAPVRTVRVQAGDTLEKLARIHLGDGSRWPEILQANADTVKRPEQLRIGMVLRLPAAGPTNSPAPASAPTEQASSLSSTSSRTYTVQAGDTLYGIARKTLGNGTRWKEILQANSDLLHGNPANLKPGMKLTIPSQ